jgi:DNA-binding Lrp family transcriptional regulator
MAIDWAAEFEATASGRHYESYNAMAKRLGVSKSTVIRHAKRLGREKDYTQNTITVFYEDGIKYYHEHGRVWRAPT